MLGFYTDEEWFDTQINPNLYESRGGTVRNNIVINTQLEGIGMYAALDGKMYNNTIIDAAQTTMPHYTLALVLFGQKQPTTMYIFRVEI